MLSKFAKMTSSSHFFDIVLFLLSILVTGLSFISISELVLEVWQFSFIRGWPEIWKSEIPSSEFCSISGDWDELEIQILAEISLIISYWLLQNARVTAVPFLIYKITPSPPKLGLNEPEDGIECESFTAISYWSFTCIRKQILPASIFRQLCW